MISHWAIPLAGIDPAHVRLSHVHASASRLADRDHWASPKPWSARPPRFVDGLCVLEITTLTHEAATCLHANATAGAAIVFGNQTGTIVAAPQPLESITWNDLHAAEPPKPVWTLTFRTPATFGNRNRFSPWPDPSAVARSLTTRWNALNPNASQHLDEDPRAWRRIWVSDVEGHTELLPLPGLTVPGFLGRIRYQCDDPATARTLHRLLLLAQLAGLGRYTTRGLGIVDLTLPTPASGPDHNRVASGNRNRQRSVQRPHQHKHPKTEPTPPHTDPAERRGVQPAIETADQNG